MHPDPEHCFKKAVENYNSKAHLVKKYFDPLDIINIFDTVFKNFSAHGPSHESKFVSFSFLSLSIIDFQKAYNLLLMGHTVDHQMYVRRGVERAQIGCYILDNNNWENFTKHFFNSNFKRKAKVNEWLRNQTLLEENYPLLGKLFNQTSEEAIHPEFKNFSRLMEVQEMPDGGMGFTPYYFEIDRPGWSEALFLADFHKLFKVYAQIYGAFCEFQLTPWEGFTEQINQLEEKIADGRVKLIQKYGEEIRSYISTKNKG